MIKIIIEDEGAKPKSFKQFKSYVESYHKKTGKFPLKPGDSWRNPTVCSSKFVCVRTEKDTIRINIV